MDISQNKLEELPESIGNLSSLGTLDISLNKLTELPKSIETMSKSKLTELFLYGNMLPTNIIRKYRKLSKL